MVSLYNLESSATDQCACFCWRVLQESQAYRRGYSAAQRLSISSHLVSRITGTIYVSQGSKKDPLKNSQSGRTNVGFNLKFNKSNREVCYARVLFPGRPYLGITNRPKEYFPWL